MVGTSVMKTSSGALAVRASVVEGSWWVGRALFGCWCEDYAFVSMVARRLKARGVDCVHL